ncbi:MAG: hypothetical protein JO144_08460, partial [Actinobacteria bacterium]|nr:hypothetical protein [Actinomycetota bacterium]
VFAFWFVVTMATPVLLWWLPVLGCGAGVLFALADLRYDDVAAARWAFGVHGLLCALVGWWLVRAAAEQRRVASAASVGHRVAGGLERPTDADPAPGIRWLAAGLLALVGIGCFAWYGRQVSVEQAHLRRALPAAGRVVEVRPDESVTVEVRTPSAGTRRYRIGVYDYTSPYPKGSTTPVLLDPRDPGWIRLVAEPQDVTYWQSAGTGCWLLALLCLLTGWRWRRGLRALGSGELPALGVRIRPDLRGRALIMPAFGTGPDADRPIARLAVMTLRRHDEPGWHQPDDEPDPDGPGWDHEAFGRSWRDEEPVAPLWLPPGAVPVEDAVLIGDLSDRGVAMLVTAEVTLLPTGRLRVGGLREGRQAGPAQPDQPSGWRRLAGPRHPAEPELFAGAAVQAIDGPLPELPLTVRARSQVRLAGAAMLLVAFAGYPAAVWLAGGDQFARITLALGLGRLTVAGAGRLLSGLRLEHARFEVAGLWWTHSVPWDRLHGVRRTGDRLSLAWQPDTVLDVGPFDDPGGAIGRQHRAEQLGSAMMLLRRRALLGGLPGRATSRRPNATWLVPAGFGVLVLLTLWWR